MRRVGCGPALLLLALLLAAGDAVAQLRTMPPAGFEGLDAPQTAPLDLHFGGRRLGEVMATFTSAWIRLADPAAVAARLDALRPESAAEVVAALSGELEAHAGSSCLPTPRPGCGTLEVAVAGVILNADYFRLDLVVAPPFLLTQGMDGRHLAEPVSGPSLLANLSAGGSGGSEDDGTQVAGLRGRLSRGRDSFRLDAFAQTDSDRPVVDIMAAEHHGEDHLLAAGLLDDEGGRFSRIPALLGGRVQTYLDTRLDLEAAAGTPIIVFLAERSRVEILVDGRLVEVRSYEAGNQRIDTSRLPRGAYEVTLRIQGGSGSTREERLSFVKDAGFPPGGEWQYLLAAGLIADDQEDGLFPELLDVPVVKASAARRLRDDLAGTLTLSATDQEAMAELELRQILPLASGGLQLALGSGGGAGIGIDLGLRRGAFSLSLGGDLVLGGRSGDDDDDDDDRDWQGFRGLEHSRRSVSASAGYGWRGGGRLSFRGYYRDHDDESWGFGPELEWPLHRGRSFDATWQLGATMADDESLVLARIRFQWRVPGRPLRLRGSLGARWRDGDDGDQGIGATGSLGASYNLDGGSLGEARLDAEVARDVEGTDRLSLDGEIASLWGSLTGGADLEREDGETRLRYHGFVRSTVAANRDGVAIGGYRPGDAAILARFDGDPAVGDLLVRTSASRAVPVAAGSTAVLPLAPFRVYRPSARSAEGRILDLRQPGEDLPLYPGNVATARWQVRQLLAFYGRAVHGDGSPVAYARIQGADGPALTDADGYFVLEVEQPGPYRLEPGDGRACSITLPAPAADAGDVIAAGELGCVPP